MKAMLIPVLLSASLSASAANPLCESYFKEVNAELEQMDKDEYYEMHKSMAEAREQLVNSYPPDQQEAYCTDLIKTKRESDQQMEELYAQFFSDSGSNTSANEPAQPDLSNLKIGQANKSGDIPLLMDIPPRPVPPEILEFGLSAASESSQPKFEMPEVVARPAPPEVLEPKISLADQFGEQYPPTPNPGADANSSNRSAATSNHSDWPQSCTSYIDELTKHLRSEGMSEDSVKSNVVMNETIIDNTHPDNRATECQNWLKSIPGH